MLKSSTIAALSRFTSSVLSSGATVDASRDAVAVADDDDVLEEE
jgi:hypothetical protein